MVAGAPPTGAPPTGTGRADGAIAALLVAGAIVVPLVFDTGRADAFAAPKTAALRAVLVAALAVAVVRFARRGLAGLTGHRLLDVAVGLFVVTQLVAFGFSIDRSQSLVGEPLQLQGLAAVLIYVTSFYLARLTLGTERRVAALLAAVSAAGAVVAGYSLMQRAGADPWWDELLQGRVFSSIGQPNALGAYFVIVVAAAAGLVWAGPGALRALGVGAVVAAVPALAFTRSRGAFLGLAVVLAVLAGPALWAGRARWRSAAVALAGAGLVAVVLVAAVAPARSEAAAVWRRAASAADLDSWDAVERLALWEVGWSIAVDHPWVGTGQETYPLVFPEYRDRVLDEYRAGAFAPFRPESPHNAYLGIAAGSGFPALAAFLVALGAWGVLVGRAAAGGHGRRRALLLAVAAAAAGHAVTSAFMTPEVTGTWLFWTVLGAGAALATFPGNSDFAL